MSRDKNDALKYGLATWDNFPAGKRKATKTKPPLEISDLQAVKRDFAFVVESSCQSADLLRAAQGAEKNLIRQVRVFDIFDGEALGAGKKSVAIEVTLQPSEKTLTDDDIAAVADKIVDKVEKATGGSLRA